MSAETADQQAVYNYLALADIEFDVGNACSVGVGTAVGVGSTSIARCTDGRMNSTRPRCVGEGSGSEGPATMDRPTAIRNMRMRAVWIL